MIVQYGRGKMVPPEYDVGMKHELYTYETEL